MDKLKDILVENPNFKICFSGNGISIGKKSQPMSEWNTYKWAINFDLDREIKSIEKKDAKSKADLEKQIKMREVSFGGGRRKKSITSPKRKDTKKHTKKSKSPSSTPKKKHTKKSKHTSTPKKKLSQKGKGDNKYGNLKAKSDTSNKKLHLAGDWTEHAKKVQQKYNSSGSESESDSESDSKSTSKWGTVTHTSHKPKKNIESQAGDWSKEAKRVRDSL